VTTQYLRGCPFSSAEERRASLTLDLRVGADVRYHPLQRATMPLSPGARLAAPSCSPPSVRAAWETCPGPLDGNLARDVAVDLLPAHVATDPRRRARPRRRPVDLFPPRFASGDTWLTHATPVTRRRRTRRNHADAHRHDRPDGLTLSRPRALGAGGMGVVYRAEGHAPAPPRRVEGPAPGTDPGPRGEAPLHHRGAGPPRHSISKHLHGVRDRRRRPTASCSSRWLLRRET